MYKPFSFKGRTTIRKAACDKGVCLRLNDADILLVGIAL